MDSLHPRQQMDFEHQSTLRAEHESHRPLRPSPRKKDLNSMEMHCNSAFSLLKAQRFLSDFQPKC